MKMFKEAVKQIPKEIPKVLILSDIELTRKFFNQDKLGLSIGIFHVYLDSSFHPTDKNTARYHAFGSNTTTKILSKYSISPCEGVILLSSKESECSELLNSNWEVQLKKMEIPILANINMDEYEQDYQKDVLKEDSPKRSCSIF